MSLIARNHYDVLGVARDATAEDIKAAYRRLVKLTHPDQGGSEILFAQIRQAYEVLSAPQVRRQYDQQLAGTRQVTSVQTVQSADDPSAMTAEFDDQWRPFDFGSFATWEVVDEGAVGVVQPDPADASAQAALKIIPVVPWAISTAGILIAVTGGTMSHIAQEGRLPWWASVLTVIVTLAVPAGLLLRAWLRPVPFWEWLAVPVLLGAAAAFPALLEPFPVWLAAFLPLTWWRFLAELPVPQQRGQSFGRWWRECAGRRIWAVGAAVRCTSALIAAVAWPPVKLLLVGIRWLVRLLTAAISSLASTRQHHESS